MDKAVPDLIAVARLFIKRDGNRALATVTAIAHEHELDESEDAGFWAKVAEVLDATVP
jgi:hypothetical protein